MPRALPVAQMKVVRAKLRKGLTPREIADLKLPELGTHKLSWIHWAVRRLKMRESVKAKPVFLTDAQEWQLADFIRGEGKDLPASLIQARLAEKGLVLKQGVIFQRRIAVLGKPEKRIHRCKPEDSRQISIAFKKKREVSYFKLCALRLEMERGKSKVARKTCSLCSEEWYKTKDFFYPCGAKGGSNQLSYCSECRICTGEVRLMRRCGVSEERITRFMTGLYRVRDNLDAGNLKKQMALDTKQGSTDPLAHCRRCRKAWFWNRRYFRAIGNNSETMLIDTCRACYGRLFFHK